MGLEKEADSFLQNEGGLRPRTVGLKTESEPPPGSRPHVNSGHLNIAAGAQTLGISRNFNETISDNGVPVLETLLLNSNPPSGFPQHTAESRQFSTWKRPRRRTNARNELMKIYPGLPLKRRKYYTPQKWNARPFFHITC